jgi:fatty acid desaturase
VPSRVAWLALHVALIAAGITALALRWGGWWAAPLYALVIGHSFAGCAFVGHEMMHGAVVRNLRARQLLGWICFLPFTLSPRLWVAWHNKTHHGNTMSVERDPDAFPTMQAYRQSRLLQVADFFSFGAGHFAGFMTLLLGFTGQSTQMMWRWSKQPDSMPKDERQKAVIETLAGYAVWGALLWALGPLRFLFAFAIPLTIGNFVVISYILTNHSLSPLTDVNDPLLNSLSVTVPWWVDKLHLNFGLHVEHHLFPSMSSHYAPLVRDQLVLRYPERYQSLPIVTALAMLARTPRVYGAPTILEDPKTGLRVPTLQPREAEAPESAAA